MSYEDGFDPEIGTPDHKVPFILAAKFRSSNCLKVLLEAGVNYTRREQGLSSKEVFEIACHSFSSNLRYVDQQTPEFKQARKDEIRKLLMVWVIQLGIAERFKSEKVLSRVMSALPIPCPAVHKSIVLFFQGPAQSPGGSVKTFGATLPIKPEVINRYFSFVDAEVMVNQHSATSQVLWKLKKKQAQASSGFERRKIKFLSCVFIKIIYQIKLF